MKKLLFLILFLMVPAVCWAPPGGVGNFLPKWGDTGTYLYPIPADRGVAIGGTGPSTAPAYIDSQGNATFASGGGGGSGDVTSVGDCTSGACLDGTSDGGSYVILNGATTYLKFNDSTGSASDWDLYVDGNNLYFRDYVAGISTVANAGVMSKYGTTYGYYLQLFGDSDGPGMIILNEDTDNGTSGIALVGQASVTSPYAVTLPTEAGTILTDTNIGTTVQAYDAQLTDLSDGIISGDFVNTAYPWGTDEVSPSFITSSEMIPSNLGQASATTGQVLKWDGNQWAPDADAGAESGASTAFKTITGDSGGNAVADVAEDTLAINGDNGITVISSTNETITVTGLDAAAATVGVVELATTAETTTGTDTGRAVTPGGLEDGFDGSTNIVTLGTISTGAWNGDAIPIGNGGTGSALTDPNDDRIGFWDDSAGAFAWLDLGSGLTITGTSISASTGTAGLTALDDIGDPDSSGDVNLTVYSWTIQTPNGNFVFGTDGSFTAESFNSGADTHVGIFANEANGVTSTWVAANYSGQMPFYADTNAGKYYYFGTDDSTIMEVAAIDSSGTLTIEDASPSIKFDDSTASATDWDIYADGGTLWFRDYASGGSTVLNGVSMGQYGTTYGFFVQIHGDSTGPAFMVFNENTGNGTDGIALVGQDSVTSPYVVTLPASAGTLALTTGNVSTATALAANGGNCNAGEIALGVDASGAVEGCYEPAFTDVTGSLAAGQLPSVTLTDSDIGTTVQAYDAQLADLADGTLDGNFVNTTYPWAVNEGGTGTNTLTDGGILLGSGTGAITATAVLTDGQMIVGDGTTDPAIESGATLRTSIGVGTGDSPQFTDLTLSDTTPNITLTDTSTGEHDYHIYANGSNLYFANYSADGGTLGDYFYLTSGGNLSTSAGNISAVNDDPAFILGDSGSGDENYRIQAVSDVLYFANTDVDGGTTTNVMQLTKTEVQNNVALDQNGAADFASTVDFGGTTQMSAAGVLTVNGAAVYIAGGTDVPDADVADDITITSTHDITTTGTVEGLVDVMSSTASTTVLAAGCDGTYWYADTTDAVAFTLPAASVGLLCAFSNIANAGTVTVYSATGDILMMGSTVLDAGDGTSSGDTNATATFMAVDSTYWTVTLGNGSWTDAGQP